MATKPWRKYRIGIHFEQIRTIPIHSDIIPNKSEKRFVSRLMKNGKNRFDLTRFNARQLSEWIRNQVFNPNQSELEFIRIDSDWKFILNQSDLGWIRIGLGSSGLNRIDFLPFFIKRDTKRFSNWFGMIRIGSEWIPIRYFRQGYFLYP